MTTCRAKHTRYQPTAAEFVCPSCGAAAPDFYVGDPADGYGEGCELNHADDYLLCMKCGEDTSGVALARAWQKKHNLVACTHCKGTGLVKR